MKVRVLQVAGQECEPTSFARLMDELAPIDYSWLAGTVLLDEDEWDEWCEDLRNAHEREVGEAGSLGCQAVRNILATKAQGLDAMTDAELAERGLVRLPVDADGVTWTGEEQYAKFKGCEYCVRGARLYEHEWELLMMDLDGKQFSVKPAMCHHTDDDTTPAPDTPASLADELRDWFVEGKSELRVGDKVIRKNGRIGTVIGGAIGKDGKHCLVLSMHDGHWRTYLCPIDEARKLNTGLDFEAEA